MSDSRKCFKKHKSGLEDTIEFKCPLERVIKKCFCDKTVFEGRFE